MKKWNKLLGMVIPSLCLVTMTPTMASADDCCYDPCCDPCSFGGFDVGVDFIYWKPCFDNLDFASVAHEVETGGSSPTYEKHKYGYKCLCLDWEPGFRVRFGKEDILCNWDLTGSYLWLDINSKGKCKEPKGDGAFVTSPLFAGVINDGSPSNETLTYVDAKFNVTYQNWDALLSYDLSCNRCYSFSPFFGVEGLILNQKLTVNGYVDPETDEVEQKRLRWTSDYFGVGLKMGTAYEFEFNCFKFYANASGVITVGDHDGWNKQTRWSESGDEYSYVWKDGDCCQFVPGYHLALGLLYETDACGCEYAIRLGWEFTQWHNITNPRRLYEDDAGGRTSSTSPDVTTIGFHGLVLGLDLSF